MLRRRHRHRQEAALTDSVNPTDYLKKMRKRDAELGSYLGTNCPQVAMETQTLKIIKCIAVHPVVHP